MRAAEEQNDNADHRERSNPSNPILLVLFKSTIASWLRFTSSKREAAANAKADTRSICVC